MVQLITLISVLCLAFAAAASPLTPAIVQRNVTQPLTFVGIEYHGEGCPPNSIVPGDLNFDTWEFEVYYKKLTASIGEYIAYKIAELMLIYDLRIWRPKGQSQVSDQT